MPAGSLSSGGMSGRWMTSVAPKSFVGTAITSGFWSEPPSGIETMIVLSPTSVFPSCPVAVIVTAWSPAGSGLSGNATHLPRASASTTAIVSSWVAMVTDAPGSALPAITASPSLSMRTTSSCGFSGSLSGAATGPGAGGFTAVASAGVSVAGAVAVSAAGGGSTPSNRSG